MTKMIILKSVPKHDDRENIDDDDDDGDVDDDKWFRYTMDNAVFK